MTTEKEQEEDGLDIGIEPSNIEEIMEATKDLKNGKAPGQDHLNAELFECHPELTTEILFPLFAKVWNGEGIPSDGSKGVIIQIPKIAALSYCNN